MVVRSLGALPPSHSQKHDGTVHHKGYILFSLSLKLKVFNGGKTLWRLNLLSDWKRERTKQTGSKTQHAPLTLASKLSSCPAQTHSPVRQTQATLSRIIPRSSGRGGGEGKHALLPSGVSTPSSGVLSRTGAVQRDHSRDAENTKPDPCGKEIISRLQKRKSKKVGTTLHLLQKVHFPFSTSMALPLNTIKYYYLIPLKPQGS